MCQELLHGESVTLQSYGLMGKPGLVKYSPKYISATVIHVTEESAAL